MPRLSLPLGQDDEEDDSLLLPPRSAGLEDQNFTVQSIELPRRALSEQPPRRLSRGSFGSIRLSDQFADLDEIALNGLGDAFDSSLAIGGHFNDHGVPDMYDEIQGYVSHDYWMYAGETLIDIEHMFRGIRVMSGVTFLCCLDGTVI
jgi:hypothetical protein